MEWVDKYCLRPLPIKEKSLVENFKNLTIKEEESIDIEPPTVSKELHSKL
jgi:hypothetical protein